MAVATAVSPVAEVCRSAKRAARELARADSELKDAGLERIAEALEDRVQEILEANERDMQAGVEAEVGEALLIRLQLAGPNGKVLTDVPGNPRPTSGSWNQGAYQAGSTSSGAPPPPTNLTLVVH